MIAQLLLCMAFVYPLVVGACEGEKKDETLLSFLTTHEECFTSLDDEGKEEEEGENRLASDSEDMNFHKDPLMDENTQESAV